MSKKKLGPIRVKANYYHLGIKGHPVLYVDSSVSWWRKSEKIVVS